MRTREYSQADSNRFFASSWALGSCPFGFSQGAVLGIAALEVGIIWVSSHSLSSSRSMCLLALAPIQNNMPFERRESRLQIEIHESVSSRITWTIGLDIHAHQQIREDPLHLIP